MSVLGRALLSEMCRLEHTEEPVRPTVPLIIVSSEFCYEESPEMTSGPPQQRRDPLCPPETSKAWQRHGKGMANNDGESKQEKL